MTHPLAHRGITSSAKQTLVATVLTGLSLLFGAQSVLGSGTPYYPTVTSVYSSMPSSYRAPAASRATTMNTDQYSNYPGFVCYQWNTRGECVDFSYYNTASSSSAYHPDSSSRDCYDNDGRYDTRYCRNSSYSNNLTVRVTASDSDVREGDSITYKVYLKNNSDSTWTSDIRAELDDSLTFISASNNGDDFTRGEVEWRAFRLPARASATLTFRARVNTRANDGDQITVRVDADGTNDDVTVDVNDRSNDCYDRYGRYDSSYCNNSSYADCYDSSGRYNSRYCNSSRTNYSSCYDSRGHYNQDLCTNSNYGNCYDSNGRYDARYCNNSSYGNCYDSSGRYDSRSCRGSSSSRYGDCYDSYGRYNSRNCDNGYGTTTLSVTGSPSSVRINGLITYNIHLDTRNYSSNRTVTVTANLDPGTTLYSASDNGTLIGRSRVEWRDVDLFSSTRNLTLSVRADSVRGGDTIRLDVSADGQHDTATTTINY